MKSEPPSANLDSSQSIGACVELTGAPYKTILRGWDAILAGPRTLVECVQLSDDFQVTHIVWCDASVVRVGYQHNRINNRFSITPLDDWQRLANAPVAYIAWVGLRVLGYYSSSEGAVKVSIYNQRTGFIPTCESIDRYHTSGLCRQVPGGKVAKTYGR